jgi:hypothetical protein
MVNVDNGDNIVDDVENGDITGEIASTVCG